MFSNVNRRILVGSTILFFWIIATIFSDIKSVNPKFYDWFYISKTFLLISCGTLIIMALKDSFLGFNPNKLFLTLAAVYTCLGEIFCPGYHLAFVQLLIVTILIYDVPKKFALYYLTIFPSIFFLIFSFLNFNYVEVKGYSSYHFDIYTAIISVSILSLCAFFYILEFKKEKEYYTKKYEFLGKNISAEIHDLKAKMLAPIFSIDQVIKYQDRYSKEEKSDILIEIQEQLNQIKESLKQINEFSDIKKEKISVKNIVQEISKEFEMTNVQIFDANLIEGNKDKIEVVLRNLIKNSKENADKYVPIIIEVSGQKILFKDNGGGFPRDILSKLNEGIPVLSDKKDGNGVGLASVHNLVQQMNGSIKYFNKDNWACIQIVI